MSRFRCSRHCLRAEKYLLECTSDDGRSRSAGPARPANFCPPIAFCLGSKPTPSANVTPLANFYQGTITNLWHLPRLEIRALRVASHCFLFLTCERGLVLWQPGGFVLLSSSDAQRLHQCAH